MNEIEQLIEYFDDYLKRNKIIFSNDLVSAIKALIVMHFSEISSTPLSQHLRDKTFREKKSFIKVLIIAIAGCSDEARVFLSKENIKAREVQDIELCQDGYTLIIGLTQTQLKRWLENYGGQSFLSYMFHSIISTCASRHTFIDIFIEDIEREFYQIKLRHKLKTDWYELINPILDNLPITQDSDFEDAVYALNSILIFCEGSFLLRPVASRYQKAVNNILEILDPAMGYGGYREDLFNGVMRKIILQRIEYLLSLTADQRRSYIEELRSRNPELFQPCCEAMHTKIASINLAPYSMALGWVSGVMLSALFLSLRSWYQLHKRNAVNYYVLTAILLMNAWSPLLPLPYVNALTIRVALSVSGLLPTLLAKVIPLEQACYEALPLIEKPITESVLTSPQQRQPYQHGLVGFWYGRSLPERLTHRCSKMAMVSLVLAQRLVEATLGRLTAQQDHPVVTTLQAPTH